MIPLSTAQLAKRQPLLLMLFCFSFLSYLLRMNISVAQHAMVPELGLSDIQIGAVFSAFMLGYCLLQVPAGICGDRFGPRPVLACAALAWAFLTLLSGVIPGKLVKGAFPAFVSLLILRFLFGAAEAATYPVAGRAIANWMPEHKHAFSTAVVIEGAPVGSAVTAPLIAYLMQALGWRATFYVSALLPGVLAMVWWWRVPDRNESQIAIAQEIASSSKIKINALTWWSQLRSRNIAFLCASYFLDSFVMFIFVFWLFKYLTDVRRFTVVGSGWATSLPFVAASFALPSFGYLSDRLSARRGVLWGRRAVAMGCLICAGTLLFLGAATSTVWLALIAISLSVAFVFSTEGCYWSTAIGLSGTHAGAAGGLMNTAGNLGGVVSTIAVPLLVRMLGWYGMFALASALAILGALLWLLIRPSANANPSLALPELVDVSDVAGPEVSLG